MKAKKLVAGFGIFLFLTVSIGIIGFFQINILTATIETLERYFLPRERVILEMKIHNALYAMGVRNYVSWRISKYLQAAAIASDIDFIEKSSVKFRENLALYQALSDSQEQKSWVKIINGLALELEDMGRKLINLTDSQIEDKEKINRLLMSFENKFYRIDDFLLNTLSKSNLGDIEEHLQLTYRQKNISISILMVSLIFCVILGIVIGSVVYRSLEEERRKREWLVHKMIRLEEEERKNLSRQIHDQLSQDLSALKIYLELIERDIVPENTEQKTKIEKSKKILNNLIERGHNISELLRPPELDDLGLVESIASLIFQYREAENCKYNYYKPVPEMKLAPEYSLALYRITQESLTNISKHAKADRVTVSLQQKDKVVYLTIADNGVGFSYGQYLKRPHRRSEDQLKLGLQGLRERIEFLGGKLAVKTAPGKGTIIQVELYC